MLLRIKIFFRDLSFTSGFFVSLFAHFIMAIFALVALENNSANAARAPQVFTVTLEGGEKIGGISQVPKKNSKKEKAALDSVPDRGEKVEKKEVAKKKAKKKLEVPSIVDDPEKVLLEKKKKEKALALKKKKQAKKKKKLAEKKKKAKEAKKAAKLKAEKEKKEAALEAKRRMKARIERDKRLSAIADRMKNGKKYSGESANAGGEGLGAARLGGKGMGGGALASAEKIAYANALQQHVKSGWRWLTGKTKLRALIVVRILKDGKIASVNISESSGNRNFDDSVVRAVKKADPVPAPPADYYSDFSSVRFWFDSHDQ